MERKCQHFEFHRQGLDAQKAATYGVDQDCGQPGRYHIAIVDGENPDPRWRDTEIYVCDEHYELDWAQYGNRKASAVESKMV